MSELQVEITVLHDHLQEKEEEPAESNNVMQTKTKGAFNEKLRQCVYYFCLNKEVPCLMFLPSWSSLSRPSLRKPVILY